MKVMQEHLVYWKELAERKIVVVFGPVADPKETYRLAIVEAEDVAIAHEYGILDPAIKADLGFKFEVYPMPQVILRE